MNIDYHALLPEIILSGTILLVLVVDVFLSARRKWMGMPLSLLGVLASLVAALTLIGGPTRTVFGGMFVLDHFALLFQVFFLSVAVVVLAISLRYFREGGFYQGEYYFLLLTSFLGCLLMPASRDLLMLFISLELVSAPGFLMSAFRKNDVRSNEAGLKFFLIGVLSTAVMLYGMSLIYGLTGATNLSVVASKLAGISGGRETMALAGILFVVVGFAFKVSAFPFQFWAPDTYEGSPVPVAAFLAVASKAAGFAGLLQLMFVAFINQHEFWVPLFAFIAVATMTIGNLVALQQRQVVRLLAYSGIAQAGYILMTFALVTDNAGTNQKAFSAAVAYILIYGIMNLGAFAVTVAVSRTSPQAAHLGLRGAGAPLGAAGGGHDHVHDLAGRRAAHGRVLGEDPHLQRGHRARRLAGDLALRGHAAELRGEHLLLLRRAARDDLQARHGRVAHERVLAGHGRGGAGHGRARRGLHPAQPVRAAGPALHARRGH